MRAPFLLFTFTLALAGQDFRLVQPLALIEFLSLTPAQLSSINANNTRLSRLITEKEIRRVQLLREIDIETRKTPLDPVALGLRYAEAETLCRDIRNAETLTRQDNVALLTEPQRVRMRALEEAVKLLPVATQAESFNLADFGGPLPTFGATDFASLLFGIPSLRSGFTCGSNLSAGRIAPSPSWRMSVEHRQNSEQY